ncbi:hypothetical protein ACHAW5_001905, partial [Stephanodiscus triporus]
MTQCTCGPHPVVDLTAAYRSYRLSGEGGEAELDDDDDRENDENYENDENDEEDEDDPSAARETVLKACRSHGCFHAVVRLPPPHRRLGVGRRPRLRRRLRRFPPATSPFAGSVASIGRDVESLFSSSFLRRASDAAGGRDADEGGNDAAADGTTTTTTTMRDGGILVVPFLGSSLLPTETATATFRGRTAEGGDGRIPAPEPKLSWEFRRCIVASSSSMSSSPSSRDRDDDDEDVANRPRGTRGGETVDSSSSSSSSSSSCGRGEGDERDVDVDYDYGRAWDLLPAWTDALHAMAMVVIDMLGIPPNVALSGMGCRCRSGSTSSTFEDNDRRDVRGPCNVDLLRAFRYDAVVTTKKKRRDDDDIDNEDDDDDGRGGSAIGSSPHTDWGTLTVVWQDDRGGLQTHCRGCDKWSDVAAAPSSSYGGGSAAGYAIARDDDDGGSESMSASFFVHVGDFLSLATIADDGDGSPAWPSPRHRVLCPSPSPRRDRRAEEGEVEVEGDGDGEGEKDCRRSLVYFAYPPPGVSLDDVRRIIAPLLLPGSGVKENTATSIMTTHDDPPHDVYNRYSLLHNQSHRPSREGRSPWGTDGSSCRNDELDSDRGATTTTTTTTIDGRGGTSTSSAVAARAHARIRGMPFDRVVMEKWNQ